MPRIRLLKFDSKTCPMCRDLDRRGTLDTILNSNPDVDLVTLTIADENGDTVGAFEEAYAISDDYDVQSIPAVIITDATTGMVFDQIVGSERVTKYQKAIDAAREALDDLAADRKAFDRVTKYVTAHPTMRKGGT